MFWIVARSAAKWCGADREKKKSLYVGKIEVSAEARADWSSNHDGEEGQTRRYRLLLAVVL
jgi:hypothetical protein